MSSSWPDFPGQESHVVIAAVSTEGGEDGEVVVLVAIVGHQQLQLIGQQRQTLLPPEHPHWHQLSKKAQVHAVLAGIGNLQTFPLWSVE